MPYETRCKTGRTTAKVRTRSRFGIFCNECTQSTTLDPKLTFWCVLYYLAAFRTVWLPYETWCKTGRTSAKVRATKSRRNFSHEPDPPLWTLNYHFGAFRTICVYSGPFVCLTKLGAKRAELVQKFVPRIRVGIFRKELIRSTPITP